MDIDNEREFWSNVLDDSMRGRAIALCDEVERLRDELVAARPELRMERYFRDQAKDGGAY